MRTQRPERIDELLSTYPAAACNVALYRSPSDGVPTTIHVGVKRADEAFLGFRPTEITGPGFLVDHNGLIGRTRQRVDVVMGNHTIAEHFGSTIGNVHDVRDAFLGRGADAIKYFVVVTKIDWHARRQDWRPIPSWDPRGSILRRQLDVSIRIPPKKGGFAALLSNQFSPEALYFCMVGSPSNLAHCHPSWQIVERNIRDLCHRLYGIICWAHTNVRGSLNSGWNWEGGELAAAVLDPYVTILTFRNSSAGLTFKASGYPPATVEWTVEAFHGTLNSLEQLAMSAISAWDGKLPQGDLALS